MIYIIKRIWFDNLENHISDAVGYNIVGYVNTLEEAENIVKNGKTYKSDASWTISKGEIMTQYKYEQLENFNNLTKTTK